MPSDTFELVDDRGPEKVVCVCDRRTGMRGVLVVDKDLAARNSPFPVAPDAVFAMVARGRIRPGGRVA